MLWSPEETISLFHSESKLQDGEWREMSFFQSFENCEFACLWWCDVFFRRFLRSMKNPLVWGGGNSKLHTRIHSFGALWGSFSSSVRMEVSNWKRRRTARWNPGSKVRAQTALLLRMMNVECVDNDSAQKLQCTNNKLKTTNLSQSFRVWCLKLGATMSSESSLVRKLTWKDAKKTVISV